jgi:hypothetical protein
MSFHLSAEDIRIEDGHRLIANLRNENGDLEESEIDLNSYIGNNNGISFVPNIPTTIKSTNTCPTGNFQWEGEGLSPYESESERMPIDVYLL